MKAPDGRWESFEWNEGALFAIPLNAEHRLINATRSPVLALAQTNAPIMMDHFHNPHFGLRLRLRFHRPVRRGSDYFKASGEVDIPNHIIKTNVVSDIGRPHSLKDMGGTELEILGAPATGWPPT